LLQPAIASRKRITADFPLPFEGRRIAIASSFFFNLDSFYSGFYSRICRLDFDFYFNTAGASCKSFVLSADRVLSSFFDLEKPKSASVKIRSVKIKKGEMRHQ
jgi:hypothetical protein